MLAALYKVYKFINQKVFVIVLAVVIFLIFAALYIAKSVSYPVSNFIKTQPTTLTPGPTPVKFNDEYKSAQDYLASWGYFESNHATSPDGNFVSYFYVQDTEKTKGFGVEINGLRSESVVEFPGAETVRYNYLFREGLGGKNTFFVNNLYHDFLYRKIYSFIDSASSEHIAWSNNGTKVAILVPEKLIILEFENLPGGTYKHRLSLVGKREIPLAFYNSSYSSTEKVFFSGDDSRVWLGFARDIKGEDGYNLNGVDEVYVINMNSYQIERVSIKSLNRLNNIFPIPKVSGIAYWTQGEADYKPAITFDLENGKTVYQMPDSSMDYLGEILISPDRSKVCLEYGSSGFWGYLIYELPSMHELLSGEQYSYCSRWINNNEIVIVDHPYFDQSYYYTYLFNTKTGEKILIDETGDQEIFNRERFKK